MAQFRKVLVFVCTLVFLMAVTFAEDSTSSPETTATSGASAEPEVRICLSVHVLTLFKAKHGSETWQESKMTHCFVRVYFCNEYNSQVHWPSFVCQWLCLKSICEVCRQWLNEWVSIRLQMRDRCFFTQLIHWTIGMGGNKRILSGVVNRLIFRDDSNVRCVNMTLCYWMMVKVGAYPDFTQIFFNVLLRHKNTPTNYE